MTVFLGLPADAWFATDFDGQGVPDAWDLGLLAYVLCHENHPLNAGVMAAYQANLAVYEGLAAGDPNTWGWITSLGLQYYYAGMATLGTTENAVAGFGLGTPFKVGSDEPLSATGDLDGDGYSNLDESQYVASQGGVRANYVNAASGGIEGPGVPVMGILGLIIAAGALGLGGSTAIRRK